VLFPVLDQKGDWILGHAREVPCELRTLTLGFNEYLQRGHGRFIRDRNPGPMLLAAALHPLPPAPVPDGSIGGWIWLTLGLALVVLGGFVLASRR